MDLEFTTKVKSKGLDMYDIIEKAEAMDALTDEGIKDGMLDDVIAACEDDIKDDRKIMSARVAESARPHGTAVLDMDRAKYAASVLKMPVNFRDWEFIRDLNRRDNNTVLPSHEEILEVFGTWEAFWEAAGFSLMDHDRDSVVNFTLDDKPNGCFARKEFDEQFPDLPSSRLVEGIFGTWKDYQDAVKRLKDGRLLPAERIRQLADKGMPIGEIEDSIIDEFRMKQGIELKYRSQNPLLHEEIEKAIEAAEKYRQGRILTRSDLIKTYKKVQTISSCRIKGFRFFDGVKKARTRELMATDIVDHLVEYGNGSRRLSYAGLEGVNFTSYIYLQQQTDMLIDPSTSLVAEEDEEVYAAMRAIVDNQDILVGGEIFRELNLEGRLIHLALDNHSDKRFDVINLDFMGGWSASKEAALENLFGNMQVADNALLYITLLNSALERHRVHYGNNSCVKRKVYGTEDQDLLVRDKMANLCGKYGFSFELLHREEYFDTQPMLFFGFHLRKKTTD